MLAAAQRDEIITLIRMHPEQPQAYENRRHLGDDLVEHDRFTAPTPDRGHSI